MDVFIVIGVDWEDYKIDSVWDDEDKADARCEDRNKKDRTYVYHVEPWNVNGAESV
jgi:hypothetical protein